MPAGSGGSLWYGPIDNPPNGDLLSDARLNQKTNYIGSADPSITFAGMLYYNTSTDTLEIRKADNASWFIGLNQSLKSTDSPIFAGLTIGALSGVLKGTAGVVGGSATCDDIADGITYVRTHNDFSSTYKNYLNQSVTSSATPIFAGLTLNYAGTDVLLIETTADSDVGVEIYRNKTAGSYNESWYMHIPTSHQYLQWDIDGSTYLMQLSTSGTLSLAGSLYVNGGSFGLEVTSNVEVGFQFGRTGLSYPIIWTQFIDVSSTLLQWYQSTTGSTVMSLDHSGNLVIVGGLTIATATGGVLKATAGVVAGSATLDDIGEGTTYKRVTATIYGYLSNANAQLSALYTIGSPTFAGLTLTAFSGFVKATAGILSAAALTDADIPNDITLTNITQITNRSHTSLSDIGTLTHATIDTYLDQAVKAASSPVFVNPHWTGYGYSTQANLTTTILAFGKTGDANWACTINSGGRIDWGAGGAIAVDTNLYRSGANILKTDDAFYAVGNITTDGNFKLNSYGTTTFFAGGQTYMKWQSGFGGSLIADGSDFAIMMVTNPTIFHIYSGTNDITTATEILKLTYAGQLSLLGYVQPTGGYNAADGTAGVTFAASPIKSLTVKNGLVVAYT
jgi:hypothetical protein